MKIGGSVSYKVNVAPYETMEVSSFLELEVSGELSQEELEEKQNQITNALKNDVNKKAKDFIVNFHEKIKKMKTIME
jgi:hypothetical protein